MGSPAVLNASVFLFFFAFGYLLSAKRPILTRSTRFVLIALFASAAGFALTTDPRLKDLLATVTIAINVAFIAFAAIDFIAWRKRTN
jgi:multisubunit Na+/H+ antiporter MnhC subunit